jgi:hypothetical protein
MLVKDPKENLDKPNHYSDVNPPTMSDALFSELERRRQWSIDNPGHGKSIFQIAANLGVALC